MPVMNTQIKGGGITPTQTLSITTNGVHDVTTYAYADVQVPNPSTGTLTVTSNATYNVTNYASVDVQVPTTAPALYRELQINGSGILISNTTTTHVIDFTGITDVAEYVLTNAYYQNTGISGNVNMNSLTTISGNYACQNMFRGCSLLTGCSLNSLTINGF